MSTLFIGHSQPSSFFTSASPSTKHEGAHMPQREGTGWSEGKTIAHELMWKSRLPRPRVHTRTRWLKGRIWCSCFGRTVEEAQRTRNPAQSYVRIFAITYFYLHLWSDCWQPAAACARPAGRAPARPPPTPGRRRPPCVCNWSSSPVACQPERIEHDCLLMGITRAGHSAAAWFKLFFFSRDVNAGGCNVFC